ncbi:MAG: hypothetical protein JOY80_10275 [Candidatus Dormibacteraeota bacterium]|nr:hypothetical protein [Candidatus Dormibacteraeota bacterium]
MIDWASRLDAALDDPDVVADAEIAALTQLATEVATTLRRGVLASWQRDRLYSRALELAGGSGRWARARRILLDNRMRAIAGGAAVTLAAGTAITVAVLRQHRHHTAPIPA